jgi:hypothetical protein
VSKSNIVWSEVSDDLSYTYVNATLEAEFPQIIEQAGLMCPTTPLILRNDKDKVRILKHPLFAAD